MQRDNQVHLNGLPDKRVSTALTKVLNNTLMLPVNVALTATDATRTVFVATYPCKVLAVKEVHSTASTSGTLTLEKCTGTVAPGSGDVLLTATMSLAGTANTVVSGTVLTNGIATLAAGDRLSIKIAGTMTNLAGGLVSIMLVQV